MRKRVRKRVRKKVRKGGEQMGREAFYFFDMLTCSHSCTQLKFKVPDADLNHEGSRRLSGSHEKGASADESSPARRPSE